MTVSVASFCDSQLNSLSASSMLVRATAGRRKSASLALASRRLLRLAGAWEAEPRLCANDRTRSVVVSAHLSHPFRSVAFPSLLAPTAAPHSLPPRPLERPQGATETGLPKSLHSRPRGPVCFALGRRISSGSKGVPGKRDNSAPGAGAGTATVDGSSGEYSDESDQVARAAQSADTRIQNVELHEEAAGSYLAYCMSVIVGRALPDVRDGLKPVHRRILFAMHELGLSSKKPFKKCARVVGEVLGKFHPHGDTAVYDALVRMAQSFSLRSPLIDGHGNFGSLDADPAAAMRYTECKLQALSESMLLADIELNTVDMTKNFDGSVDEPTVLPARVPHLLVNGAQGIAVGMATNIPPHNLGEVVDAFSALIHNPNASIQELMEHCPGPDFPTGGIILGNSGLLEAYSSGHGSLTLRGQARIESSGQNRQVIIITEIPYQGNKAKLVERIAALADEKKVDVSAVRDESDRSGTRVVVEVKRGVNADLVLNSLYKLTGLQIQYSCNMVTLVNNEPKTVSLRDILHEFLEFRVSVIERRTAFQLKRAEERDHTVEGLLVALSSMDEVVAAIRSARETSAAARTLHEVFGLSEAQSEAVLAMPLRRLTALERGKLEAEHLELQATITDLRDLLQSRKRVLEVAEREALAVKREFGTPRRTALDSQVAEINERDLIPNEPTIVTMSERGYVKRMGPELFAAQRRGTSGKSSARLRGDDTLHKLVHCKTHDSILFFSDRGTAYSLPVYQVQECSRTAVGNPIGQLLPIQDGERITSLLPVDEFGLEQSLVMLTRDGFIKRTPLKDFSKINKSGLVAIQLSDDDELLWVRRAVDGDTLLIASEAGQTIRFSCDRKQLRTMGRASRGMRAMRVRDGDRISAMDILPPVSHESTEQGPWALLITLRGQGKRVPTAAFTCHNRGGRGVTAIRLADGDSLVALYVVGTDSGDVPEQVMVGSQSGNLNRLRVQEIPIRKRASGGCAVMRLDDSDCVNAVAIVPGSNDDSSGDEQPVALKSSVNAELSL